MCACRPGGYLGAGAHGAFEKCFAQSEIRKAYLALISGRQMSTCASTVYIFLVAITKKKADAFFYAMGERSRRNACSIRV